MTTLDASADTADRHELLARFESRMEMPMLGLGVVWLALLMVELVRGTTPWMETLSTVIWGVFLVDFGLRLFLAPSKRHYLKANWLVAISLVVPALRVFRLARAVRLLRAARAARGIRLFRLFTALNRGSKALGKSMARRGFGYVAGLTTIVAFAGAAGMFSFEKDVAGGLTTYGGALWWTLMVLTSMGSEYWPKTTEGRALCLGLALYGFTVFGYLTATLASFFVDRDAASNDSAVAGVEDIRALRDEIRHLLRELERTRRKDS